MSEEDRLILRKQTAATTEIADRISGQVFFIPTNALAPSLRSFANLPSISADGKIGLVIRHPVPQLDKIMASFYGRAETKQQLARIRQRNKKFPDGRWQHRVLLGSTNVAIGIRFDLAAPGTTVFACHAKAPFFLGAFGFMVNGLDEEEARLFTLWANSTMFLAQALRFATTTRGSWCKFEKSAVDKVLFPTFARISADNYKRVSSLFDEVAGKAWPSLLDQLRTESPRTAVDQGLLEILGFSASQATEMGRNLRAGVLTTIEGLLASME
jgi:hypothetical protein